MRNFSIAGGAVNVDLVDVGGSRGWFFAVAPWRNTPIIYSGVRGLHNRNLNISFYL
jgi:hypothetical protein